MLCISEACCHVVFVLYLFVKFVYSVETNKYKHIFNIFLTIGIATSFELFHTKRGNIPTGWNS